jgi:GT2 family glycosyltransferase
MNEEFITKIIQFQQGVKEPDCSIVIVAYATNWALVKCLESLTRQSAQNYEIIVVDNGKNDEILDILHHFSLRYIKLKDNYLPSLARNIGTGFARSSIVCFLDDDAIAHPDFVSSHLEAHRQKGVVGVRGKVLPKTGSIYNFLTDSYDLGNAMVPSYIELEGNSSFSREVLLEVGGFDPEIYAGEGAELSYRIVKRNGKPESLIYWPGAVIYHDFSYGVAKYLRKTWRGAKMHTYLQTIHPDFWDFIESYHPFPKISRPRPNSISKRVQFAFLRRMGRALYRLGSVWYRRIEL